MKKNLKNPRNCSLLLLIVLIGFALTPQGSSEANLTLSLEYNRTFVNYGEYKYGGGYLEIYDSLFWSFTSLNENITLKIIALSYLNYQKFKINDSTYTYLSLTNENMQSGFGFFDAPYKDRWYILLINQDPKAQGTELLYRIFKCYNFLLFITIPILMSCSFIAMGLISNALTKRKNIKIDLGFTIYSYFSVFLLYVVFTILNFIVIFN